jgi:hypothetical protein
MAHARFLACAAALGLAACQTAPSAPKVTRLKDAAPEPVSVALSIGRNPGEGLTVNDWGGEVPQSKPAADVGEGGLGDLD